MLEEVGRPEQEKDLDASALALASLAMARGFAAGATMWCVAPCWPSHGSHVAVEFVHPVIVGKRALPAVHLEAKDLVGTVRVVSRPGDIVVALGGPGDVDVEALLRRCEAWGLTTVWIGAGRRPHGARVDHLIWVEGADMAEAARSGELVLRYHLLWELTHVVFEHPGLLTKQQRCNDDVCITCSDEGRLAEITFVHGGGQADVVAEGSVETVDVSLVDQAQAGDLVLVHAGVAITRVEGTRS
jgi:hydrogenase maturation factor